MLVSMSNGLSPLGDPQARSLPSAAKKQMCRQLTDEGEELVAEHPAALAVHQVLLQLVQALALLRRQRHALQRAGELFKLLCTLSYTNELRLLHLWNIK